MARVAAFSPSRLAVYQRCARRYYWQYVVRVPRKRTGEQALGIALHAALEATAAAGKLGAAGVADALAALERAWDGEGFADADAEAAARRQAEALLAAYVAQAEPAAGMPVMLEKTLKGRYADVPLVGIVDRVDRRPDGTLALIDYKSGRGAMALDDPATVQQLAIYRHLVGEATGEVPRHVAIHHVVAGVREVVRSEAGWRALLDEAAATARAIEAEDDFAPRVAPGCASCDYAGRCQAYQRTLATSSG